MLSGRLRCEIGRTEGVGRPAGAPTIAPSRCGKRQDWGQTDHGRQSVRQRTHDVTTRPGARNSRESPSPRTPERLQRAPARLTTRRIAAAPRRRIEGTRRTLTAMRDQKPTPTPMPECPAVRTTGASRSRRTSPPSSRPEARSTASGRTAPALGAPATDPGSSSDPPSSPLKPAARRLPPCRRSTSLPARTGAAMRRLDHRGAGRLRGGADRLPRTGAARGIAADGLGRRERVCGTRRGGPDRGCGAGPLQPDR